jgi:hypothetical protein
MIFVIYVIKFKGTPNEDFLSDNQVLLYDLIMVQFEIKIPMMIPGLEPYCDDTTDG